MKKVPVYRYEVLLVRVLDGDTVELSVDLGFGIYHVTKARLAHVDTPEMSTPEGKRARIYVTGWCQDETLTAETYKTADKYGRWLASLYRGSDPLSLSECLLKDDLAKPYEGGAK